jgi:hypothetical protein
VREPGRRVFKGTVQGTKLPLKTNVAGKKFGRKKKLEAIGDKLRHRSPRWIFSPTFPPVGLVLLFEIVFGSLI